MKIVVDTNVIFSALLNSNSKIGELLLQGGLHFEYYSVYQLKDEILKHKQKIISISNLNIKDLNERLDIFNTCINYINLDEINDSDLIQAESLVSNIDENDLMFVALSLHLNAKLWTGDKKLITGLKNKGFENCITSSELFDLYLSRN